MGNKISTANSTKLSTEVNENQSDFNLIVCQTLNDVIHNYVLFLLEIIVVVIRKHTDNIEREKRKFNSVRKELLDFLSKHRMYFKFDNITFYSNNGSISHTLTPCANFEQFLKLDDFVKLDEKISILNELSNSTHTIVLVKEEVIKRMKIVLKKSVISNEDIQMFLCNHYLIEKKDIKTNCSNYKELKDYIHSRVKSYTNKTVCKRHINKMSFKFQGSIKHFENKKSCCVCLEDYEKDQEICHLPCNHFCCRNCTEEMFAIPEDGSYANFQCPICRDDCT